MNATFLLLGVSLVMGADESAQLGQEVPPPVETAPVPYIMPSPMLSPAPMAISSTGCASCGGCSACGAGYAPGCADPNPEEKTGLFARIKKKFGRGDKNKAGCQNEKSGLFSKLFHHDSGTGDCSAASGCASCNAMPAMMPAPVYYDSVLPAPYIESTPTPAPMPETMKGDESSQVRIFR